jgi:FKBP-type peptidyl-prolyl cis-trans isomerase FklB
MKKSILLIFCGLITISSFAQVKKPVTTAKPAAKPAAAAVAVNIFKNNKDSVSYAVGLRIAQSLKAQGLENVNMTLFAKAMTDFQQNKKSLLDDAAINQCVSAFQQKANAGKDAALQKENAAKAAANKQEGMAFLAANGKRAGVTTLPSGIQYEVLTAGTGTVKPTLASTVTCNYLGTLINGTKFDASADHGGPATFPLANVIRGWQESLQLMTVGSKWKLYIPADLAYGDNGPPNIGAGATLIFEVELLKVEN